jgi:hypothetical protein
MLENEVEAMRKANEPVDRSKHEVSQKDTSKIDISGLEGISIEFEDKEGM